jgi:hypothetical protein
MRRYSIILFLSIGLIGCDQTKVSDWSHYYESQYKTPYGTSVLKEELQYIFPDAFIDVVKKRTQQHIEEFYGQQSTLMYVNPEFYPDEEFMDQLLEYNNSRNTLFIATNEQNNSCFSILGVETGYHLSNEYSLTLNFLYDGTKNYTLKDREKGFHYFATVPSKAKIRGTIQVGDTTYPNFIALSKDDQSQIFLHCNPELYSNYHLLNKEDALYSLKSVS